MTTTPTDIALLTLLRSLLQEWRPSEPQVIASLTLDSHLEHDLALDSLARTELLQRIEAHFGVLLGEKAFLAETPRALLSLITDALGAAPLLPSATDRPRAGAPVDQTAGVAGTVGTVHVPSQAQTLVEMLSGHVEAHPDRLAIRIVAADDRDTVLTFASLHTGAQRIAAALQARGLQPQQTVAIMLPTSGEYFLGFFGILLAGGIPVPIYPPTRPSQVEEHLQRHVRLLNNAETFALITVPEAVPLARLLQAQVDSLRHVVTAAALLAENTPWRRVAVQPRDLAFLQYTSGSTGDPKGVMLSHANVIANVRAMGRRVHITPDDVFVSWLPLYHDMGLIGACFGSLYHAAPLVVMSPLRFLGKPLRWLQAIHQYGGTLSAAPNFAYDLCVRSAKAAELKGLDLHTWRMAFNGAEPVSPTTMARFNDYFGPYGLRSEVMTPVYGLAECSVGLAIPAPGRVAPIDRIQRAHFMATGQALPTTVEDAHALCFPACGYALADHTMRIVDDQGRVLPDRQEGRVEFQGPSATAGYYRHPTATARLFPHGDQWHDSGDRGYLADGDIYLTGRVKDMIIRGGRNLYPYELEQAVGDVPGVRKGCVAVFASADPATGSERLIIVAETRVPVTEQPKLRQIIQHVSADVLGAVADEVVFAPAHAVLKTSSGKIRRSAMRELYERGAIGQTARALWLQLAKMTALGWWARLRRTWSRAGAWLFSARAWTLFGSIAPLAWLGVMILPTEGSRFAFLRTTARGLARFSGTPLAVQGIEHLPEGPCVLVANHASFLDAYVLMAALPRPFHFVAKKELRNNRWIAAPLQRLGILFVERFDRQRSAEQVPQLIQTAQSGASLVFFPEGTFLRAPGLLAFRMGAFVTAAHAGIPIVPVTLRGTRVVLPDGTWRIRRGAFTVTIAPPISPESADWTAAVALRDKARAVIVATCGEPDGML